MSDTIASDRGSNPPPAARRTVWDRLQRRLPMVQTTVTTALLLLGAFAVSPIIQAKRAIAELDRITADLEMVKRSNQTRNVLESTIKVAPLGDGDDRRWISFSVELRNAGNRSIRIPAATLRAGVARVAGIDPEGHVQFEAPQPLELLRSVDDQTVLKALVIEPGESQALTSLQTVPTTGTYVVTISAVADGVDGYDFVSREFFSVK